MNVDASVRVYRDTVIAAVERLGHCVVYGDSEERYVVNADELIAEVERIFAGSDEQDCGESDLLSAVIGCMETALEVAENDLEQSGGPEATIIEQLEAGIEHAKALAVEEIRW